MNTKYVQVIDGLPAANKKGLRIKAMIAIRLFLTENAFTTIQQMSEN